MPDSLNVIALISGGKDSLYSILHCLHYGHKVVALANLCPPKQADGAAVDDMDSMTYQTIGHQVIPLYEQCVGVPVFQVPIRGTTVCDQQDYLPPSQRTPSTGSDETEDLINLLTTVKQAIPEANAVSSGAILSTYQRTRVESVVLRLGMTPLAYLWQYPFLPPPPQRDDSSTGLLDDMLAAGCDARLVKTASYGIAPDILSKSLSEPKTIEKLVRGFRNKNLFIEDEAEFRASVLGEGGEYETLTVNGPSYLWRNRIQWKPSRTYRDGEATSELDDDPKIVAQDSEHWHAEHSVRIPAEFDPEFQNFLGQQVKQDIADKCSDIESSSIGKVFQNLAVGHSTVAFSADHLSISNVTAAWEPTFTHQKTGGQTRAQPADLANLSAAQQMELIAKFVGSILHDLSIVLGRSEPDKCLNVQNVASTMLLLASMNDFSSVNVHYGKLFPCINPPARCTFAADLNSNVKVSLNMIIDLRPIAKKRSLHVQSRSYWAPANIGPYSQAVAETLIQSSNESTAELVHFAGQIPLRPIIMETAFKDDLQNMALSLQHLWRVGQERKVDLWAWGVAFLAGVASPQLAAQQAFGLWCKRNAMFTNSTAVDAIEQEDEVDVWDLAHNRAQYGKTGHPGQTHSRSCHHTLPNRETIKGSKTFIPPFVAAEVSELPRGVPIEWWSIGLGQLPRGSQAKIEQPDCQVCNGESGEVLYRTLQYNSSESEPSACFVSASIRQRSSTSPEPSYREILTKLFQHTHVGRRRIVSGHCLIGGSVGVECHAGFADEPWMQGIAVVPCRNLYFGQSASPSLDSTEDPCELEAAAMVLLIRTEESPQDVFSAPMSET